MTTALAYSQELLKINPFAMQRYLKSTGWTATPSRRPHLVFFATERDGTEYGISLPLSRDFRDYPDALSIAVERLAEVERRLPTDVITMLNDPIADVIKFRRIDASTENGTLPLDDAPKLLQNIRKALYTVVCDELQPAVYHQRLHSKDADKFLKQCSLGQSERGSYITTVICPFATLDETGESHVLSLFDDTAEYTGAFARRVTIRLMKSLERIFSAIESDELDALYRVDTPESLVSGNLLEALLGLTNETQKADIEISTQWAAVAPLTQTKIPHAVKFTQDHFVPIKKEVERIRIRKNEESSRLDEFVGRVSQLKAEPDIQKRTNGEIILNTFDLKGEVIKAQLVVSPAELKMALRAIDEGLNVRVRGILKTEGRIKRIEYTSISLLDELPLTDQTGI